MKSAESSANYLILEKFLRFINGIVISSLIARYFGPEAFGEFNTYVAITMMLFPIVMLGVRDVLISSLGVSNDRLSLVIVTSVFSLLVSGITYTFVVFLDYFYFGNSVADVSILKIVSLSLLILPFEPFLALIVFEGKGKYSFYAGITQSLVSVSLKSSLVFFGGDIYTLAYIYVFDMLIFYLINTYLLFRYFSYPSLKMPTGKDLLDLKPVLRQGFYLMLAGLAAGAYMRMDILLIEYFLGFKSVGQYSLSVKLVEALYFIPAMLTLGLYPTIVQLHAQKKHAEFSLSVARLSRKLMWFSLLVILFFLVFADFITDILFGVEYDETSKIVKVYCAAFIIMSQGFLIEKIIILKFGGRLVFYSVLTGLFFNVFLNVLLVPAWGVYGAAISTVLCQVVSYFLFYIVHPSTRSTVVGIYLFGSKK